MSEPDPSIVVVAGPNGAGKTTAGPDLVSGTLGVNEFVNADVIAQGLSAFRPEEAAFSAGRIMLGRLKDLASRRVTFGFETTLASRTFAPWIRGLMESGYRFDLLFLLLPDMETAIERVRHRIRLGGHAVPEEVIRRRYRAGLENFFGLYRPLATRWSMYDNSKRAPSLVAAGAVGGATRVNDDETWTEFARRFERR